MSLLFTHSRSFGLGLIFLLGATLVGCSGDAGDTGAKRTQQQSEALRDRLNTTQIDR